MDLPKFNPDFIRISVLFISSDPAYILVAHNAWAVGVDEDNLIPLVSTILPNPVAIQYL